MVAKRASRRWLWLLIPFLGIGASLALPPLDEYAALDRIGTRVDPNLGGIRVFPAGLPPETMSALRQAQHDTQEFERGLDERLGIGRHRAWRVRVSEAEARRTLDHLLSLKAGWQSVGSGSGSDSDGEESFKTATTIYQNDETGDQAELEKKTRTTPLPSTVELTVSVAEMKASMRPWPRLRRWARRIFSR